MAYFTINANAAEASESALALTSSLVFLESFQFLVTLFTEIQSSMTGV